MNPDSRRQRRRILVSGLLLGLAVVIGWWFLSGPSVPAAQTGAAAPQRVSIVDGVTVITLDIATQTHSGIRTEALQAADSRTETTAYATVLDLQPLLDLRTRNASAIAESAAAGAAAAASGEEYRRDQLLYRDNQNVALKVVQAAAASFRADQARADAAALAVQSVRSAALQQFGQTLTHWALDQQSTEFARLANRQAVLLRVTVPLGDRSTAPARIEVDGGDSGRVPADLISASPQSDPAVQGRAFLYRTTAQLAAGTRVAAYLPTAAATTPGVFIPGNAIVWYGGQPWAYVQIAAERFARTPVDERTPDNNGYVVTHGFVPGARVVSSGAQLLLSEELRPQAGSSAACKDPECD